MASAAFANLARHFCDRQIDMQFIWYLQIHMWLNMNSLRAFQILSANSFLWKMGTENAGRWYLPIPLPICGLVSPGGTSCLHGFGPWRSPYGWCCCEALRKVPCRSSQEHWNLKPPAALDATWMVRLGLGKVDGWDAFFVNFLIWDEFGSCKELMEVLKPSRTVRWV